MNTTQNTLNVETVSSQFKPTQPSTAAMSPDQISEGIQRFISFSNSGLIGTLSAIIYEYGRHEGVVPEEMGQWAAMIRYLNPSVQFTEIERIHPLISAVLATVPNIQNMFDEYKVIEKIHHFNLECRKTQEQMNRYVPPLNTFQQYPSMG